MSEQSHEPEKANFVVRLWCVLTRPALGASLLTLLVAGFAAGIVFWGGFNWAMELTNTETFCVTCHEMEQNVFREYKKTSHYGNRTGVRATCPDCHVPDEWVHKFMRKMYASNELFHHFAGTVNTPEKFEAKRIELATNVWRAMKQTDSRECRNCHDFDSMDFTKQESRARERHDEGVAAGKTCIDCHIGVAHSLPENAFEAYEAMVKELDGNGS